jgi:lysyl-tRNA synthetase class II
MASLEEIREARLKKIAVLKEHGRNPFTALSHQTHTIDAAIVEFDRLVADGEKVTLAGRIMSLRAQGAIMFATFLMVLVLFRHLCEKVTSRNHYSHSFLILSTLVTLLSFQVLLYSHEPAKKQSQ